MNMTYFWFVMFVLAVLYNLHIHALWGSSLVAWRRTLDAWEAESGGINAKTTEDEPS